IPQAEMTSCGPNGGPLEGRGEYPAYLACHLFSKDEAMYTGGFGAGAWMDSRFPKITQEGRDGEKEIGYIANMTDSATAGFKYFDCRGVNRVKIKVRGYCQGAFEVLTAWKGPALGIIPVDFTNVWTEYAADIAIPYGVQAVYLKYTGNGSADLASFSLE
ncbi:MAG: alpha-N-arabinofuranosidase, partial [Paenibacillaceae bacterium]|nr:alpha-N-arabinofuranosidase [Paenibacillaceae bacterium]